MPVIDQNRLKGNYGAAYVTSLLSSECLVRPVAIDTDVGVDLYCETVEEELPFLHFWVQVKAGQEQINILANGEGASCTFEVDHLRYWYRQPVPVYVALVPLEWPVVDVPHVYIVYVSDQLIENPDLMNGTTRNLRSDYILSPGDQQSITDFLQNIVPQSTARLQCKAGIVSSVPTLQPNYVQILPNVPIPIFQREILFQLRRTSAFSIIFMYYRGELNESNKLFVQKLAEVLANFEDDMHYENFWARALYHHAESNFEDAAHYYQQAIECIQNDPQVANQIVWQQKVNEISELLQRANSHNTLQTG